MGRKCWNDHSANKTNILTIRLTEKEMLKLKLDFDNEMKNIEFYRRVGFSEWIRRKLFK